jgi:DNA polymerase III alpha subunit
MGLRVLPPDVNASGFRTSGQGREVRVGFQFIKGLSGEAVERIEGLSEYQAKTGGRQRENTGETGGRKGNDPAPDFPQSSPFLPTVFPPSSPCLPLSPPFSSLADLRSRTGLRPDDLRLLIKVGALDSIAGGMTRPMMLWAIDAEAGKQGNGTSTSIPRSLFPVPGSPAAPPALREYSVSRRRQIEYELLGFTTDGHPMDLYAAELRRFRVARATELSRHVGKTVLCAGMLTTSKPVHTIRDEPMEFATFDDGTGLIETVLFPRVYRDRGHVLFDQGPFLFRGKVEEEFGAVTVTIVQLERLERAAKRGLTIGD